MMILLKLDLSSVSIFCLTLCARDSNATPPFLSSSRAPRRSLPKTCRRHISAEWANATLASILQSRIAPVLTLPCAHIALAEIRPTRGFPKKHLPVRQIAAAYDVHHGRY